jgi:hypothetical protein
VPSQLQVSEKSGDSKPPPKRTRASSSGATTASSRADGPTQDCCPFRWSRRRRPVRSSRAYPHRRSGCPSTWAHLRERFRRARGRSRQDRHQVSRPRRVRVHERLHGDLLVRLLRLPRPRRGVLKQAVSRDGEPRRASLPMGSFPWGHGATAASQWGSAVAPRARGSSTLPIRPHPERMPRRLFTP